MTTTTYHFTIYQNATFVRRLYLRTKAGKGVNLAGYTARMQLRSAPDGEIYADLNDVNGGAKVVPEAGCIEIRMEASETALFAFERAVYDLMLIAADGTATRLLEGNAKLSPGVTE